ncbi:hypothetical protein BPAE_0161g00290 [Botrytis paeoniae]|uniref:Uncharacterized protein n=1 Tax=Botrytis paeoniae TaxID=278948 RepID=A0A4Z1FJ28_9HELO|nr:hypothetical protein BPAE_0161g00290 [Botrytis paeoniae]
MKVDEMMKVEKTGMVKRHGNVSLTNVKHVQEPLSDWHEGVIYYYLSGGYLHHNLLSIALVNHPSWRTNLLENLPEANMVTRGGRPLDRFPHVMRELSPIIWNAIPGGLCFTARAGTMTG